MICRTDCVLKECKECWGKFTTKNKDEKYCSAECREEAERTKTMDRIRRLSGPILGESNSKKRSLAYSDDRLEKVECKDGKWDMWVRKDRKTAFVRKVVVVLEKDKGSELTRGEKQRIRFRDGNRLNTHIDNLLFSKTEYKFRVCKVCGDEKSVLKVHYDTFQGVCRKCHIKIVGRGHRKQDAEQVVGSNNKENQNV